MFEFGVPVLHEILRELQSYVVLKLREKLNTIKQVLPLLHHFDTRARKSKVAIVKFVRTLLYVIIKKKGRPVIKNVVERPPRPPLSSLTDGYTT